MFLLYSSHASVHEPYKKFREIFTLSNAKMLEDTVGYFLLNCYPSSWAFWRLRMLFFNVLKNIMFTSVREEFVFITVDLRRVIALIT